MDAIFIIGSGRTGTHLMCNELLTYKNTFDDVNRGKGETAKENEKRLLTSTETAIKQIPLPDNVIKDYKGSVENKKVFINQDHTNLFHVEQLLENFPDCLFFAMKRPIPQVVSSMLRKPATLRWFEWSKKNGKFPNKFTGIKDKNHIKKLSIEQLCAKRVRSHYKEINRLKNLYPKNIVIVEFEKLVKLENADQYIKSLITKEQYNQLGEKTHNIEKESDVLTKHNTFLTDEQKKKIANL
jgi:hypothetical protein